MLYKVKNLSSSSVLKSLYYSLFNAHMSYGISLWGIANKSYLQKVFLLQKKAIRIVTQSEYLENTSPLFKTSQILKLDDLYFLQLSSLMWDYDHDTIPPSLKIWFNVPNHKYGTRFVSKRKLTPCVVNTYRYGIKSFKYQGKNILNQLKDLDIYTRFQNQKHIYQKNSKTELLSFY